MAILLAAPGAEAADSPVGLSVSLERFAGIAYTSARPTDASASIGVTAYGIGGPAFSPFAFPRAGADVILPTRLTLGAALGIGGVSVTVSPDQGQSTTVNGTAWLVSPRVGYLLRVAPFLDLWPRAGLTFIGASLSEPNTQTTSGFSDSLFAAAVSVELAAVLRVTRSFNVLAGVAYDQAFTATGSGTSTSTSSTFTATGSTVTSTTTTSSSLDVKGRYLGPQLWFGLGGYIF